MTDINITIKVELNEGLEEQVERLLRLLTTATHQYRDEENDDENENGATG